MNNLLTVVIPYFKLTYLEIALDSLAAQTCGDFKIFIGDDASPHNPEAVLKKYEGKLNIQYHRFPENLGGKSLAQHWDRCVRETKTEWIWLFSDDDVVTPECVEAFYATLAETRGRYDVYRFNLEIIDGKGGHIHTPVRHPESETSREMALSLYSKGQITVAIEHIFRRGTFEEVGGFVDFPLAWFSDHASWIAFSKKNGFRTMSKGVAQWRASGINLSARDPKKFAEKLYAFRLYLCWLDLNFRDEKFQNEIRECVCKWFPNLVHYWGGPANFRESMKFWWFFSGFTGKPNILLLREFMGLTGFRTSFKNWLRRCFHKTATPSNPG